MSVITLNEEQYKELCIFEGKVEKFELIENDLTIHARYVVIPLNMDLNADYHDLVILRFKVVSYLALKLSGAVSFELVQGSVGDPSRLLGYEGVWGNWDDKIQTDFSLELICEVVEVS